MMETDSAMLGDLYVFQVIVRHGSFGQAAIELDVTRSALSHRLRRLEQRLGIRLLNRSSRTITVTEAGISLSRQLGVGFASIQRALNELEGSRGTPKGILKITALRDGAKLILAPALTSFLTAYPDVKLDVCVDDQMVDIIQRGFDAGIRYGDKVPNDMVCVALTAPVRWVVVAAPMLIDQVGLPESPADLLQLPCIQMRIGDGSLYPWELGNGESTVRLHVDGPICANETEHTVSAAISGLGFAYLPERRVNLDIEQGHLRVVLPEWASSGAPFCLYYSNRRLPPPGLRQLVAIVRQHEGLEPML